MNMKVEEEFDFETELSKQYDYLYRLCWKFDLSDEDRQDLVADTMLQALEKKDKFRPDENGNINFQGWLYTIMYNMFVNNFRRSCRTPLESYDKNDLIVLVESSRFSEDADSDILLEEVNEIVNDSYISVIDRRIILAFANGYAYQQISEIMELSIGTIKSKIHFARKRLNSKLEKYEQDCKRNCS